MSEIVYNYYDYTQGTLGINPLALVPGATRPVETPQEKAVSFDEPVQANTLHSVTKVSF